MLFSYIAMAYHWAMNKSISKSGKQTPTYVLNLRKVGGVAVVLILAVLDILRELFASTEGQAKEERRFHDSDLSGELNHRTGRLDAGTDPLGWYED